MNLRNFNIVILLSISFIISSCSGIRRKDKTVSEKKFSLYYGHGTTHLIKKNYAGALQHLLKAYDINQKHSKLLNNLGMAYYFKGKMTLSKSYLEKSIYYDKTNSDARNNLASLYFVKGQYKLAKNQYKQILEDLVYQFHYRVHHNLSLIYLREKEYEKAISHLKTAITQKEDYCAGNYQLGKVYYLSKQFNKATKSFHQAQMGTCVSNPEPHWYQALSHLRLKNFVKARRKLLAIIERFEATKYAAMATNKLRKISSLELRDNNEDKKLRKQYFGKR